MARHAITIVPPHHDNRATIDEAAAGQQGRAEVGFEIQILDDGCWPHTVIEALRSAARAGRIKVVSRAETSAPRARHSDSAVVSHEFRGFLDHNDRWIPIY